MRSYNSFINSHSDFLFLCLLSSVGLILLFQLLLSLSSLLLYIKIEFSIQYILRFQYLISFSNFPPSSTEHFSFVCLFFFFLLGGREQPLDLKLEGRRDSGLLFHCLATALWAWDQKGEKWRPVVFLWI